MKTAVSVLLAGLAFAVPAKADIFSNTALGGAALGAAAGAIIGNNSGSLHHNAWQGAAIGAGAGLLIGAIADDNHRASVHAQVPVPARAYYGRPYYGHSYYYGRPYYGASYYYGPGPTVYYSSPVYSSYSDTNYAGTGLVLGGIAGAIIGNNSGSHNAWRGAAIGAGAGLVLGAIADSASREREVVVREQPVYVPETTSTSPASTSSTPQNVTIINNYYSAPASSMSSANSLFGR